MRIRSLPPAILLLFIVLIPKSSSFALDTNFEHNAEYLLVRNLTTDTTMVAQNEVEQFVAHNLTLLMTSLVLFEEAEKGHIKKNTPFTVKTHANNDFFTEGSNVYFKDLFNAVVILQSKQATLALISAVEGGEKKIVALMNEKANTLEMTQTRFSNATGNPESLPANLTTAADLYLLTAHIIKNHPQLYALYGLDALAFNNRGIPTPGKNFFIKRKDSSVSGFITEYDTINYQAIISARAGKNDHFLIITNGKGGRQALDKSITSILKWSRSQWRSFMMFPADVEIGVVPVVNGKKDRIVIKIEKPVFISLTRQQYENLYARILYKEPLFAPVKKDQTIGKIIIGVRKTEKTKASEKEIPIMLQESIGKNNFFQSIIYKIRFLLNPESLLFLNSEEPLAKTEQASPENSQITQ